MDEISIDDLFRNKEIEKSFVTTWREPAVYIKVSWEFLTEFLIGNPKDFGFVEDKEQAVADMEYLTGTSLILRTLAKKYGIAMQEGSKVSGYFPEILKKIEEG